MKIGLIGTGLMGLPMAQKLLAGDLSIIAYNRTASKLEPLRETTAEIATSPREAIKASTCVILMLTNAHAIETVLLSEDCSPLLSGLTVIQMGTIAPRESRQLQQKIIEVGGDYLEAPVLGSIPQVKTGELIVMVGSKLEQYQQWLWLLKHFGESPIHIGEVGTAAAVKLALNQLIASLTSAFALSLGFVQRQGTDVDLFMQILRESALYAPTFDKKLKRMLDGNYANPNFPTKHLLKDTNLFISQAQEIGLNVSSLEGVKTVLEKAIALAMAEADYSSLFAAINPE